MADAEAVKGDAKEEIKSTEAEAVKEDVKEEIKSTEANGVKEEEKESTDDTPDPNLNTKIRRQMEYYFGNHNLMKDKFLKEKIKEDDGWVTIDTMLNFNRLKHMSKDHAVITNAIKDSELVEVNEAGDKVRRNIKNPLPEDTKEYKEDLTSRTIYAKGFEQNTKLDDLLAFFEGYGGIENVFMRRDFYKNIFKGSVFTTFRSKEDAQKFIDETETKYCDKPLEAKHFKEDYFKKKQEERKRKPVKEKKEKDQKESNDAEEEKDNHERETDEERAKRQMTQNAILFFKGANPETTVTDMKDFFNDFGDVGYVDYEKGQTEGYLRMKEPNSAAPTLEKLKEGTDGKITLNGSDLEMRIVEGDEELEYWVKMMKDISARKSQKFSRRGRGRGRGGRGRGRGGHRGGGKRKNDDRGDRGPAKVAKTE